MSEVDTEPQAVVNTDGTFTENWHEKYGEENKGYLSRYKDFDSLVNANVSLRKKFSKDPDTLVEIPNEKSSDEVKAAFRKALGVGESIDDYDYMLPDELAAKLGEVDSERMSNFRKFAYEELEISPAKFKKLLDYYHYDIVSMGEKNEAINAEKTAAEIAKAKTELQKQEGWKTDKEFEDKVLLANSVLRKYGGEDAVASFNAENSPLMVKFLNNIANAMSESTLKGLGTGAEPPVDTIKSQITQIRTRMDAITKEFPHNFRANSEYKELKERKRNLYKKLSA